jgi:hypothetical protein
MDILDVLLKCLTLCKLYLTGSDTTFFVLPQRKVLSKPNN